MSTTSTAPTPILYTSAHAAGRDDQASCDTQVNAVVAPTDLRQTTPVPKPITDASGDPRGDGHPSREFHTTPAVAASFLLDLAAASLDDIERVRIAVGNRLGAMERDGFGGLAEATRLRLHHDTLVALEHQATLDLQRALRKHPLGPWVKRTVGVGEKQGARLIAAIGDPYWNAAADRPRRGPAELWAYCGLHTVPAGDHSSTAAQERRAPGGNERPRRRKGQRANWNSQAKMRAHLVAESCIKQMHSPYRAVYDRERAKWAQRDTTDLHKHNHALGVVAKEVLKDLWREAKRGHEVAA